MYDTSSLEALLSQQEVEWERKDMKRREKASKQEGRGKVKGTPYDLVDDMMMLGDEEEEANANKQQLSQDGSDEDGLALSAHVSAEDTDESDFSSDDDEDDAFRIGARSKKAKNKKKMDGETKKSEAEEGGVEADHNDDVDYYPPRLHVSPHHLLETARYLKSRFDAFVAANSGNSNNSDAQRRGGKHNDEAGATKAANDLPLHPSSSSSSSPPSQHHQVSTHYTRSNAHVSHQHHKVPMTTPTTTTANNRASSSSSPSSFFIKGLPRFGKRLEKEVSMAEEAVLKAEAIARLAFEKKLMQMPSSSATTMQASSHPSAHHHNDADVHALSPPSSSVYSSFPAVAHISDLAELQALVDRLSDGGGGSSASKQPYERCNGLMQFEILLAGLENEVDVIAVMDNEQIKDKSGGGGGGAVGRGSPSAASVAPAWTRQSVDIDLVSQGGRRWVRVKATSLKNLEADFQGNNDRKPFVSTAKSFSNAAKCHMLPFGSHPTTAILVSELPEEEEVAEAEGKKNKKRKKGDDASIPIPIPIPISPAPIPLHPRLADLSRRVRTELIEDAGIDTVETYFSNALLRAVMDTYDETASDGEDEDDGDDGYGSEGEGKRSNPNTVTASKNSVSSINKKKYAWASSLHPAAVKARMEAHKALWPHRRHLSPTYPSGTTPQLVNFDVTALVAMCSDTCHAADLASNAHLLDAYAVLRRQVDDEQRVRTLEAHVYPCLDRYTCGCGEEEGRRGKRSGGEKNNNGPCVQWWRHWNGGSGEGKGEMVVAGGEDGSQQRFETRATVCPSCCRAADDEDAHADGTTPASPSSLSSSLMFSPLPPHPFTHDDLVAFIDGLADEAEKTNKTSLASTAPPPSAAAATVKVSDLLWSAEEHAAERAKDASFPHRLNWIISDVAMTEFNWIVRTIAGPFEKLRAAEILKYIHVIPTEKFVRVEMDPIFSTEEETASERKERKKQDEKTSRAQQKEQKQHAADMEDSNGGEGGEGGRRKFPKGVNRTCMLALEAAARAAEEAKRLRERESQLAGASPNDSTTFSAAGFTTLTLTGNTAPTNDNNKADVNTCSSSVAVSSSLTPSLFSRLPSHVALLECTGKVKARHKAVFGLGDSLHAVTLTANEQFLKAASEQYILIEAGVHCSRALVGKKMAAGLVAEAAMQMAQQQSGSDVIGAGIVTTGGGGDGHEGGGSHGKAIVWK